MIVVDANVLAYLWIPGEFTPAAVRCMQRDGDWVTPPLWRSELRNVITVYLRKKIMDRPTARRIMEEAEAKLQAKEQAAASEEILDLALKSGCSAYDCEYVALARKLGVKLVTKDARILREFPRDAVDLEAFGKA